MKAKSIKGISPDEIEVALKQSLAGQDFRPSLTIVFMSIKQDRDDLLLREPLVFTYGKSSVTGMVALLLDEDHIDISGVATCGWKPVGTTKTVTRSCNSQKICVELPEISPEGYQSHPEAYQMVTYHLVTYLLVSFKTRITIK